MDPETGSSPLETLIDSQQSNDMSLRVVHRHASRERHAGHLNRALWGVGVRPGAAAGRTPEATCTPGELARSN